MRQQRGNVGCGTLWLLGNSGMDHSCSAPSTMATATSHRCSLIPVLVIYTFLCRLWKHSGLTKGKSNSASFDWGRLIFIRDRMAHFYLFSSWKSKKWEVKPASPWQPLQRGFLSRWRGVIMELKFLPVHSRWAFCFVFPCFFPLGPARCGPVDFFQGLKDNTGQFKHCYALFEISPWCCSAWTHVECV